MLRAWRDDARARHAYTGMVERARWVLELAAAG
jgi:hypothetical protein